jgi:hypothetical protein
MLDIIPVKTLVSANVTGALFGTAVNFPRTVANVDKYVYPRGYTNGNLRYELLVKQNPDSSDGTSRFSLILKSYRTRVDALSNPIRVDESSWVLSRTKDGLVTETETMTDVLLFLGGALEGFPTGVSLLHQAGNKEA